MILLDTHVLVWLRTAPDQLSRAAVSAIRKELASDCVAIAAITLWEFSWLATFGRIDPGGAVSSFLSKVSAGVVILPLSPEITAQAAAFPAATFPKDPADRMIGATALLSGIALVTRDGAIRASRLVRTIW